MSDTPAVAIAPPKSKKLLLIVGVAVLVLAMAAGGGWFYISKQRAAALDGDDEEHMVAKVESKDAPTYLPLDNMVVNLADPGGEKVAQIGITFQLLDSHSVEKVKQYMPTIRSGVLLLVSQRTSEELLQREGKEKLATDILREAARPFGGIAQEPVDSAEKTDEAAAKKGKAKPKAVKKKKEQEEQPIRRVLFSSFIVQ